MTKLGQDRRQRQFTPNAAHSTGYPPALRGALLVMAAAAAAGALYGVVRAEHYLNSPTRWLAFGIGMMAVTAVLAAGLRYRTFGGYIVAVSLSMMVSVYAAEAVLWLKLPPQLPVDLGDLRQAEELELLARAAAEGRKLVPALSKPTLLSSRIAESNAAGTVGGQDAIKLGGIASAPTLFVLFRARDLPHVGKVLTGLATPTDWPVFASSMAWPLALIAVAVLTHPIDTVARVRWLSRRLSTPMILTLAVVILALCTALSIGNPGTFIYFDF